MSQIIEKERINERKQTCIQSSYGSRYFQGKISVKLHKFVNIVQMREITSYFRRDFLEENTGKEYTGRY